MSNVWDYWEAGYRVIRIHKVIDGECGCGFPDCQALYKHPVQRGYPATPRWSQEQMENQEKAGFFNQGFGVLVDDHLVIDIDPRNGGDDSYKKLCEDTGIDFIKESGFVVNTGGGGQHIYFSHDPTEPLAGHLKDYPGIDFKSSGYVIGCGSMHASGNTYEREKGFPDELIATPKKIIDLLTKSYSTNSYTSGGGTASEKEIKTMLAHIPSDITYEQWVQCGMAIHHETQGSGFDLWDTWSSKGEKYNQKEMYQKWNTFGKTSTPVTIGTIIHLAEQNGYEQPVTFEPKANQSFTTLKSFSLRGQSEKMAKKMLEDKFILKRIAIQGQITVLYAKPNTGKTLLTLWLLREAIKSENLTPENIYYVNADDTYKGLVQKLEFAEKNGFEMLAPGHNGFEAKLLVQHIHESVKNGSARGMVIILDTLKKFTDLMKKDKSSNFAEVIRQFASHGGTVIALAHTNKHRDDDNKLVHAGTSDIVDDFDCAYLVDVTTSEGKALVEFENIKNRGDVDQKVSFVYKNDSTVKYAEKLDSVTRTNKPEAAKIKTELVMKADRENDVNLINIIKLAINKKPGILKTELIKDIGESAATVRAALDKYEGVEWGSVKGERNSTAYYINDFLQVGGL